MDETTAKALVEYLKALTTISISNSQKVDAIEKLMQGRTDFAEGYRQALGRAEARGQLSVMQSALDKLQSALHQKENV